LTKFNPINPKQRLTVLTTDGKAELDFSAHTEYFGTPIQETYGKSFIPNRR